MTNCFGLIIPGRMPQTDFRVVDENNVVMNIGTITNNNQLVIFLTGTQAIPYGSAGAIYLGCCVTSISPPTNWHYLGLLTNVKPSVMFNVSELQNLFPTPNNGQLHAHIGISVKPVMEITERPPVNMANMTWKVEMGQKIVDNFLQHAVNHKLTPQQAGVSVGDLVPLSTVHLWFLNFRRRIENNMLV